MTIMVLSHSHLYWRPSWKLPYGKSCKEIHRVVRFQVSGPVQGLLSSAFRVEDGLGLRIHGVRFEL